MENFSFPEEAIGAFPLGISPFLTTLQQVLGYVVDRFLYSPQLTSYE